MLDSEIDAPLNWSDIKKKAAKFVIEFKNAKSEASDKQSFWNSFFDIFGVSARQVGTFEQHVRKLDDADGAIDYFWPGTLVIEHKSRGKNLDNAYQQAFDYTLKLSKPEFPRYIIVSDFANIRMTDLDEHKEYNIVLTDLVNNIELFGFIAGYNKTKITGQHPVNIKAAEKMGKLYDLLKESNYPQECVDEYLVRLVFCLFAEDADIFEKNIFQDYLSHFSAEDGTNTGPIINTIFDVLNTPEERRQKAMNSALHTFPYVNGGLFADILPTAYFDREMKDTLLDCSTLNWKEISPAIFGSLFQCVMDPQMRRELGAHYTSEENILKLINPLFMDDLRSEFDTIKHNKKKLNEFWDKLTKIRILDPACGCGNFLIISYRELRLLEMDVMAAIYGDQTALINISKVNIDQFYGIEIEEFPAEIAEVAMWLMDHLMNIMARDRFGDCRPSIPLKKHANIVNVNSLKYDWESLVSSNELTYIIGNPPFVGASMMSSEQKSEAVDIFGKIKLSNSIDYVGAWYHKAAKYIINTKIRCAFVSTNSICQGEQVEPLWDKLINTYHIKIDFAYRTFKWNSEAKGKAAVHCIIVGFSNFNVKTNKVIVDENEIKHIAQNINPYLVDAPSIIVTSISRPLCKVPRITKGNQPTDDGNFIMAGPVKDLLIKQNPGIEKYIHPYVGSVEFINGGDRYCFWLTDNDREWRNYPEIMRRVEAVREFRLKSTAKPTRDKADTPYLFFSPTQPTTDFIVIPRVSSENRAYIPIGIMTPNTIASDGVSIVHGSSLFLFGVLTSNMHMAWMRAVAGRLKSDYRYSGSVVYNTFPWPNVDEKNIQIIENLANDILVIRSKYSKETLATLYNIQSMPKELLNAHKALDKAVEKAYRSKPFKDDNDRVGLLFTKYAEIINDQ